MKNKQSILAVTIAGVMAFSLSASAQVVAQWTFDGPNPENATTGDWSHNAWSNAAPNTVAAGVLSYRTSGNGSGSGTAYVLPPGATAIVMTIEMTDWMLATTGGARSQPAFAINTDQGFLELELNVFTSNVLSPDVDNNLSNWDAPNLFDWDDFQSGAGAMTLVTTWDLANQSFTLDWNGDAGSGSGTSGATFAPALASITQLNYFRVRNGIVDTSHYMDLDTVTIEVIAVPEPATFTLLGIGAFGLLMWRRRQS